MSLFIDLAKIKFRIGLLLLLTLGLVDKHKRFLKNRPFIIIYSNLKMDIWTSGLHNKRIHDVLERLFEHLLAHGSFVRPLSSDKQANLRHKRDQHTSMLHEHRSVFTFGILLGNHAYSRLVAVRA